MKTYITQKFETHLPLITEAVKGKTDLRSNQKLYKKIYKYYKETGIIFTGDASIDYDTVLNCLYEDLA